MSWMRGGFEEGTGAESSSGVEDGNLDKNGHLQGKNYGSVNNGKHQLVNLGPSLGDVNPNMPLTGYSDMAYGLSSLGKYLETIYLCSWIIFFIEFIFASLFFL